MLNKTLIALSAVALLGTISVASANDVETQIGDKYPFLAKGWNPTAAKASTKLAAYEDVESRIGDKYPALEPSVASRVIALRRADTRGGAYEEVESRITDKYPALERTAQSRGIFLAMHRHGKRA